MASTMAGLQTLQTQPWQEFEGKVRNSSSSGAKGVYIIQMCSLCGYQRAKTGTLAAAWGTSREQGSLTNGSTCNGQQEAVSLVLWLVC